MSHFCGVITIFLSHNRELGIVNISVKLNNPIFSWCAESFYLLPWFTNENCGNDISDYKDWDSQIQNLSKDLRINILL